MARVESLLESHLSQRSMVLRGKEMQIPYLLAQHCHEILLKETNFQLVLDKTFSEEFSEMLYTCVLIPFIHRETPKVTNMPKSKDQELNHYKHCWLPDNAQLEELFEQLAKIEVKHDEVSKKMYQVRQNRRQFQNQMDQTLQSRSVSAGMNG